MKVKNLIIGAGISGLTYANYCGNDYLIVEKENEVGGYCRTIKKGEFVWDYAGHFFHFKTEEFKKRFIAKMPEEDIIYNDKCTKILYKGNLIDFPFQTNIHQLDKEEFIDCLYDLFNKKLKEQGVIVETGVFGADMKVSITNDGPITIILESGV